MFGYIKRRMAQGELEVQLSALLLGHEKIRDTLKQNYRDKWPGFVDDVVKGAKATDIAALLIFFYIVEILGEHVKEREAKELADAINEKRFEQRPFVFDLVAQVAYFTLLFEKNGTATKGMTGLFIRQFAEWFSDDRSVQGRVIEYLSESAMRFRTQAHAAFKGSSGNEGQQRLT